jgi:hypothetical protein
MRKYCSDAKAKGANVILCSMVPHKDWNGDKIKRGEQATFVKWTADAAKASDEQFIDINEVIGEALEKAGKDKVETFFGDARTHSTPAGAKFNAMCVISALKTLDPDPLEKYFSATGQSVLPAVIAK